MLWYTREARGRGRGGDQKGTPERGMEYMMNLRYM